MIDGSYCRKNVAAPPWTKLFTAAAAAAAACRLTDAAQGWFVITVVPSEETPETLRHFQQLKDGSIVVLTQALSAQDQGDAGGKESGAG